MRRRARRVPRPGMAALLPPGPPPDELDFIQAYEEVREKYKGTAPAAPRILRTTCRSAGPWQVGSLTARPLTPGPPRPVRSRPRHSPARRPAGPARHPRLGAQGTGGSARRSPRGHALNRASRREGGGVGRAAGGGSRGQCPVSPVCAQQTRGSRPSPPLSLSGVPPPWGGGRCCTWQRVTYLWPLLTSPNGPAPRLPPSFGRDLLTPLLCPLGRQLWAGKDRPTLSSFSEELALCL